MAGFIPNPGTNFSYGDEHEIAQRLDALAKKLGITIYGISGYRTPSHSVRVGGFANDPHTQGKAADIGVNSSSRASAAQLTDAQLASVGLYRPFPGAQEINHVQLKPDRGPLGDIVHAVGGVISTIGKSALPQKTDPNDPHTIGGVQPVPAAAQQGIDQAVVDAAHEGFKLGFGDLWDSVSSHAAYAGLFVLILAAGAYMAVKGLSKSTGQEAPA